jgi:hypothetical protein
MSITIIAIRNHEQYTVNGHLVYKDALRNWACKHDLSAMEHKAFKIYEKLIIKKPILKDTGIHIFEFTNLKFTVTHVED